MFLRAVGLPFQRQLLPAITSLVILVGLADPMIDWHLLRRSLHEQSAPATASFTWLLIASWSLAAARALAPTWRAPYARFLLRQPLSAPRWIRYLLPSLVPSLLPVVAAWWLLPFDRVATLFALLAVSVSLIVTLSLATLPALTLASLCSICVGAIGWLSAAHHGALLAAEGASLLTLPMSMSLLRARPTAGHGGRAELLQVSPPWQAVLRRDLLCLLKGTPAQLLQLMMLAFAAGAFLLAMKVNGEYSGRGLFRGACVLQTLALSPLYELLVRLQRLLGAELVRKHWPLTIGERGRGLLVLCVALAMPATVLLALTGLAMGAAWWLLFLLFTLTMVLVVCALFSATSSVAGSHHGWLLLACLLHTVFACAAPAPAYAVAVVMIVPLAWRALLRGLARLADAGASSS